jgi:hypothetical protein
MGCPLRIRTLLNNFLTLFQNNYTNKVTVLSIYQNLLVRFCLQIVLQHNITFVMTIHTVTLTLTRSSHLHSRERPYLWKDCKLFSSLSPMVGSFYSWTDNGSIPHSWFNLYSISKNCNKSTLRQIHNEQNELNVLSVTADFVHSLRKHDSGVMSHDMANFNLIWALECVDTATKWFPSTNAINQHISSVLRRTCHLQPAHNSTST